MELLFHVQRIGELLLLAKHARSIPIQAIYKSNNKRKK